MTSSGGVARLISASHSYLGGRGGGFLSASEGLIPMGSPAPGSSRVSTDPVAELSQWFLYPSPYLTPHACLTFQSMGMGSKRRGAAAAHHLSDCRKTMPGAARLKEPE